MPLTLNQPSLGLGRVLFGAIGSEQRGEHGRMETVPVRKDESGHQGGGS